MISEQLSLIFLQNILKGLSFIWLKNFDDVISGIDLSTNFFYDLFCAGNFLETIPNEKFS